VDDLSSIEDNALGFLFPITDGGLRRLTLLANAKDEALLVLVIVSAFVGNGLKFYAFILFFGDFIGMLGTIGDGNDHLNGWLGLFLDYGCL
jgi:hypothetical protein